MTANKSILTAFMLDPSRETRIFSNKQPKKHSGRTTKEFDVQNRGFTYELLGLWFSSYQAVLPFQTSILNLSIASIYFMQKYT